MSNATARWQRFVPKLSRKPTSTTLDSRTLIALAVVLLFVQLPHVFNLPLWISTTGISLIALRLIYQRENQSKPLRLLLSPITITLIAAGTALLIRMDYGYSFGRDPSVAFLFVLVAAKFAEIRRASDATLLLCLAAFLLLTQYFYSQNIIAALLTVPSVIAIAYALSILRDSKNPAKNSHQLKLVGKLLLHGLPLAALLFFIFPRLPGPLWSLPEDSMATTGLSDSMSPGSIGEISKSAAVAFRVEFDGEPPPAHKLYWRGPVLSEFDGRRWTTGKSVMETLPRYSNSTEEPISYTVMLQPHKQRWLLALDSAISLPRNDHSDAQSQGFVSSTRLLGRMMSDGQLLAHKPVSQLLRYRQTSVLSDTFSSARQPPDSTLYLPGKNPQTIQFAKNLRKKSSSDLDYAKSVLRHFNDDVFQYTLRPQLLGDSPIDEFLFRTKAGFCEHYAAAFVVLMRAAGIPARVVTGYLGGEMNNDYMIVRQADAHAWSEAYIDGAWRRFDPTGFVAPSRIEQGLSAALPNESSVPGLARFNSSWIRKAQLRWDAMNHHWQRLVVNYDNDSQDKFWERFGLFNPTLLQITLLVILAGLTWSLFILGFHRNAPASLSNEEKLWRSLCSLLQKHRLTRTHDETPSEYLVRAANKWTSQKDRLQLLDTQFSQLRFQRLEESDLAKTTRSIRREMSLLRYEIYRAKFKRRGPLM